MPLVAYIPLASLAAVLVVVAWSMADKAEFAPLLRTSCRRGGAALNIRAYDLRRSPDRHRRGTALGSFVFLHRMAQATEVKGGGTTRRENGAIVSSDSDVMVYRISGAFFFGATSHINLILHRVVHPPRVFILDFSDVPFIDITAPRRSTLRARLQKAGAKVFFAGVRPQVRRPLTHGGLVKPAVRYVRTIEAALAETRAAHR